VSELLSVEYSKVSPQYIWDLHSDIAIEGDDLGSTWACKFASNISLREALHTKVNAINIVKAITEIRTSPYYSKFGDESLIRSIIDVLLCGRLEKLADYGANNQLAVAAEVDMHIKVRNPDAVEHSGIRSAAIRGRADWVLGHTSFKKNLDGMLIVLEAKREGSSPKAIPQLMCYLVGIQDARITANKQNHHVFGVMTDSDEFRFAVLNEHRQMFISDPLLWRSSAPKIVAFLDHILQKAIESSPHTTPVKSGNRQLLNYPHHLRGTFAFGATQDPPEMETSDDSADIVVDVDDDSVVHVEINLIGD
jgi:hypothetical protein